MATEETRPTTLAGIKRLAWFLKRNHGIAHHDALELAAQKAGFENLRHAQSVLGTASNNLHQVYLTFYWAEREDWPHMDGPIVRSGRTTFSFFLPVTLEQLLPKRALYRTPYLNDFRLEAADHLELKGDYYSQSAGVAMAFLAARTLNFMATTGLRTALSRERPWPWLDLSDNADHCMHWYDEQTKSTVILDEPYRRLDADEIAWARDHEFYTVGVAWRGIYCSDYTPRLHSASEAALSRIAPKLEALEMRLKSEEWTWTAHPYDSQFISPARAACGKIKPQRIMPTPMGVVRAGAVPNGPGLPGYPSQWRPARRLELHKHLLIGPVLSSLMYSVFMSYSGARLGTVAGCLHSWFLAEYDESDLPSEQARHIYDMPKPRYIPGTQNQLAALAEVRQVIVEGYQECKPKRDLLKAIARSARWIERNQAYLEKEEASLGPDRIAELSQRGGTI